MSEEVAPENFLGTGPKLNYSSSDGPFEVDGPVEDGELTSDLLKIMYIEEGAKTLT